MSVFKFKHYILS